MAGYRIEIDEFRCNGFGFCAASLPEVFSLADDADIVTVLDVRPGEALRAAVIEAAQRCPKQAIAVHDE